MTSSDLGFEISSTDLLEWMELEEYKFETPAEGGGKVGKSCLEWLENHRY